MLINGLKILFFCLLAMLVQLAFAAEKALDEEKKITQAIQTIGHFSQIAKSFKRQNNNQSATDINQIYEHASGILKGEAYLERQDPWGVPWIFGVKKSNFFVDSVNYKKYRDQRALIAKNTPKDPYADASFGTELILTEALLASDEELDKPRKRNRRRFEQYDCDGLLIETNQISTDCRRIFFEKGAKFPQAISAETYYSGDDFVETFNFLPTFSARYSGDKYALDFSENSDIQTLSIASIEDSESTEFTLDANTLSILNFLEVEALKDISGSNLKDIIASRVNNSEVVTLKTLPDLAVARTNVGSDGNIEIRLNGRDNNIGSVLVGTTNNQNYQSLRTSGGLSANGIKVGNITNSLSAVGNSMLVAGDLGVEGNIYTNNTFAITNQKLALFSDRITHSGDINIQTNGISLVNSISSDGVNITTDNSADLNVTAGQINFQTTSNKTDGYVFNDANANPVLTIDTSNARLGIGASSIEALNVTGSATVNSLAADGSIRIRTTTEGKLLPFNIGTQDISWYGVNSITTLDNSAGTGSLAFESGSTDGNGRLYIQDNSTWQLLPLDQDSIHIGGDEFTSTATVGTNDNFDLRLVTNNTTAFTLDTSQNASFVGNITLNNTNISNVNNLQINTLSAQNNSLTFTLNENQANALRIQDSTTQYLNFDSAAKNISVGASLTLGSHLIVGDNFDINGGEIDGVSIGSNVPLTSLNVGSFTFSGNVIDVNSVNEISFANHDISAGSFTFSADSSLDFTGGNLINAGGVMLSSINPQAGLSLTINLNDTQANALSIQQGGNAYLTFDTDNNTIIASQNLVLGSNNISGSSFTITGGVIDNTVIGANTAASATFTSVAFETLGSAVNFNNQILSNVNIDSGSIDGASIGANTPLSAISAGSLTITNNAITSSSNGVDFGGNNLVTTGAFEGNIDLNGGDIVDVNNVSLNNISARGSTLTFTLNDTQTQALDIRDDTGTSFLTFNTSNNQIILGQTLDFNNNSVSNIVLTSGTIDNVVIGGSTPTLATFSNLSFGTLTSSVNLNNQALTNVNIDSGTLTGVAITANSFSIDDITIAGNQITSSNASGIDFVGQTLTTTANISAGSLDVSTISGVTNISLDNILANTGNTITIGVNNNAINIAGNALSINSGDISTTGSLTVGGTFITNSVDINGGSIDGVSIGTNTPLSTLGVGSFTITGNSITSSDNQIDFGNNTITNAVAVNAAAIIYSNDSNFSNIDDISLNSISVNTGNNINIGTSTNTINLSAGALTIDTSNDITLGGSLTITSGILNASSVNISGGTLTGVAITANSLSIDDITIAGNQITSSNASGIDFVGQTLTTTAAISAGSLDVSTISGVTNISLDNILANTGNTITIGVNNNAINIAGNALSINSGDISTTGSLTVGGTFITNSVDINGGSIDGVSIGTNTPLSTLGVGSFTITGNSITSSDNQIDFGNNTITNAVAVNAAAIIYSNDSNFSNIDDISLNSISVNTGNNINIGTSTNTINLSAGALTIDTSNDISLGGSLTITSGILNASSVNISGGTLTGVAITANSLSIDDITIAGNQITSSNASGIDFVGQTLTTTANISAGSLDVSTISGVTNISLDNILANTGNTITIGVNNNAINIAGNALSINSGDISTTGSLTVGGTFITNSVDINGGSIDGVAIGVNDAVTRLTVDNILIDGNSITNITGGNIDFGGATLTTTGSVIANGFNANDNNISNVGNIMLDSISADNTNIAINASGNVNIQSGSLIVTSSAVTINNTLDIDTANVNKITFSNGSPTGAIMLNGSNQYVLVNTSDKRTKQDIQNTRLNASNILNSFRIVDYRYIAHPTSDLITGFIAQEAQAVYSPMVSNLSNDLLGVSTSSLIPILVKGFQEQQVDLSNLTTVIDINQNNINLNKDLNVHNQTVVDTDNNLYANSLKLNNDIHIDSNEFSIKRSSTMSDLMSISTAKIANKNAQGYLSVKDVYLADKAVWMSQIKNKIKTFSGPNSSECGVANLGSARMSNSTGEVFICLGSQGWRVIKS